MWTILDPEWKKELICWACLTDLNWPQTSPISRGVGFDDENSKRDWSPHSSPLSVLLLWLTFFFIFFIPFTAWVSWMKRSHSQCSWKVFADHQTNHQKPILHPRAHPYGTHGQMTMTLHIYRPRQFQWTWFGVNRPSGCWVPVSPRFPKPLLHP